MNARMRYVFIFLFVAALMIVAVAGAYAKCGVPTTKRGDSARYEFMKRTGYAHGRPGWVVDHIFALCKGGLDSADNMQWQTVAAAKKKDRIECDCKLLPKPVKPVKLQHEKLDK